MGNEHSKNKESTKNGTIPEKHENGSVKSFSANITANGLEIEVNGETIIQQNGKHTSLNPATESNEPEYVIVEPDCQQADAQVISESPPDTTVQKEEVKKNKEETKKPLFGKLFKKKAEPPADVPSVQEKETSDQTDATEAANLQQESESLTDPGPEEEKAPETDNGQSQPVGNQEENNPEENSVMNFFKTLVNPTKTAKKETATPDATKDQSQKESQPAPTTTVAQVSEPPAATKGMSVPPPPPPEPPKMEVKGEAAAKPVKPTPNEEPKAAAKEPESSKGKSAKDTLSKFFRSKTIKETPRAVEAVVEVQETPVEAPQPVVEVQSENKVEPQETAGEVAQPVVEEQMVEEVPQPVVEAEKVDPSKAGTLEAAAKPEPPPPVQEEKKPASKSSFFSIFKPKAGEPKATPAPAAAAAAAEGAQTVKAKEEPKAAAKSSEAAGDNKPASVASQAGDDATSAPKKLEKRNSINLFFKTLGQKRHSTDAGIQTEAPAAEKAK